MNNGLNTHIDWIDGAKGVAIVSVIMLHSLPCLKEIGWMWHIGQAVPVFLFITAYLISLRFESIGAYFTLERLNRMLKRVLIPFIVVLLLQMGCYTLSDDMPSIRSVILNGGCGPGSYYVWVYLQTWVLLPFIVVLTRKVPIWVSCVIMLVFSILAEYAFVPIEDMALSDRLYRLMPIRYLMVLYLGCVWPMLKAKQKYIFYSLACVSALLILNDVYQLDNMRTANALGGGKFTPSYWVGYHWYTAFYVLIPMAMLERIRYAEVWKQAGKYSWYIFLLQMMCFSF